MTVEAALTAEGKTATELRVTGQRLTGFVKRRLGGHPRVRREGRPTGASQRQARGGRQGDLKGKEAKLSDLQVGDKVLVVMRADESSVVLVSDGSNLGGDKPKPTGDKPGEKKPEKPGVKPNGDKPVEKPGVKPGEKNNPEK